MGLGDILEDLWSVLQDVGEDGHGESLWVLEDLSPLLDSNKVWLDGLAVTEVLWEELEDLSELGDGVQDGGDISLDDVVDDLLNVGLDGGSILKANLDVFEVIGINKTVDDSSKNLLGILNGDWERWEWSKLLDQWLVDSYVLGVEVVVQW